MVAAKNGRISQQNHVIQKIAKNDFLNQKEKVTEFRISPQYRHISLNYEIARSFDDGIFLYDGIRILNTKEQVFLFNNDGTHNL